tara:strand:- start:1 stop:582 length:582 start_codon:yes stop_codon:yes gene_type:complete
MNAIPQPADLSRLKGILGKAKQVMNTVNEGSYQTGNIDSSSLTQNTDNYTQTPAQGQTQHSSQPTAYVPNNSAPKAITQEAINKSGMPDEIKKAMMENQIQQPSMNHSFSLDDVSELIEDKPTPAPSAKRPANNSRVSQQNGSININESKLRDMIKDVLIEYLSGDYTQNLTEGVIKKTINTLIKEGKIKTKR